MFFRKRRTLRGIATIWRAARVSWYVRLDTMAQIFCFCLFIYCVAHKDSMGMLRTPTGNPPPEEEYVWYTHEKGMRPPSFLLENVDGDKTQLRVFNCSFTPHEIPSKYIVNDAITNWCAFIQSKSASGVGPCSQVALDSDDLRLRWYHNMTRLQNTITCTVLTTAPSRMMLMHLPGQRPDSSIRIPAAAIVAIEIRAEKFNTAPLPTFVHHTEIVDGRTIMADPATVKTELRIFPQHDFRLTHKDVVILPTHPMLDVRFWRDIGALGAFCYMVHWALAFLIGLFFDLPSLNEEETSVLQRVVLLDSDQPH